MRLSAGCDLIFNVGVQTPMLLMLRPRSGQGQWVVREEYLLEPFVAVAELTDSYGNLCQRVVAPPGRFPKGDGPLGHSDLVGNVYDLAGPLNGAPGSDPTKRTAPLARTGAFDGHAIPNTHPASDTGKWNALQKYLAVGGRCARAN